MPGLDLRVLVLERRLGTGGGVTVDMGNITGVPSQSLLGRYSAGVGTAQSITLGTGLALSGSGVLSASGGAPLSAEYITSVADATLTAERVLTDTATIAWDRSTAGQIKASVIGTIPSTFLALTDTPDTYISQANSLVRVNPGASALEFVAPSNSTTTARTDTIAVQNSATGIFWPDSATNQMRGFWRVPPEYAGGSLTFTWRRRCGLAGTAVMSYTVSIQSTTTPPPPPVPTTASNFVSTGDNLVKLVTVVAPNGTFAVGDMLRIEMARDGGNASDTLADNVAFDGLDVTYTAYVGAAFGYPTFLSLSDTPDTYTGNALKVLRVNAAATATEFGPVLGTMATQNANAVAITDGAISLGGHAPTGVLDVQGSVVASTNANEYYGMRLWPVAPSGAIASQGMRIEPATGAGLATSDFRGILVSDQPATLSAVRGITLQVSAGTNRYNIHAVGTAANYFGGTMQVVGNASIAIAPRNDSRLATQFIRASQYGHFIQQDTSGTGTAIVFVNSAGAPAGSITMSDTLTAYNTSSDVRLKHAIAPLTAALERVRALRPVAHRWNVDDSPGESFLAHELMVPCPLAVTGLPNEVNDDGSIKPQQVDMSKLIPLLTAGLQAALAQIDALTARITTLEQALGA